MSSISIIRKVRKSLLSQVRYLSKQGGSKIS
jgi:hypothetical protein